MPNAIWTGTISFGLVQVPVRLVTATRSRDVQFRQIDEGSGARIRYRKVSEATGEEVPNDRIVKGYELGPDDYVVLDPDELAAIAPESTRTIDIEDFVDLAEIDPIYFDQPYYLEPDRGGSKAYRLLVEAMAELGKVAIGRVVLRSKERLVALRTVDGVLCVETMRYADEILDHGALAPDDDVELSDRERRMARELVESLAAPFEPERYRDEYRDAVLELIEAKAEGREIVAPAAPESTGQVIDLTAALERSLERARERSPEREEPAEEGGEAPAEDDPTDEPTDEPSVSRAPAKRPARRASPAAKSPSRSKKKAPAKKPAKKKAPAKRGRRSA